MRKSILFTLAMAVLTTFSASAANFFNTSTPDNLFNLGFRVGVNTTNRNLNKPVFDVWNCNSWGTGFEAGVVADINFRDWISIQPGFFYESRSGKYSYISTASVTEDGKEVLSQYGRDRSYNFTVPILCSVHFNLADNIRWNVEAGPYFQFILKNSVNGNFSYPVYKAQDAIPAGYVAAEAAKFDFGIKFGTSLKILDHYLIGVHYEAGCLHPWKEANLGGRNKGWVFTLGYDL